MTFLPLPRFDDPAFVDGAVFATWIFSFLFMVLVIVMAIQSHRKRIVTGHEELLSARGQVTRWSGAEGEVRITGEIWQAKTATGKSIATGTRVHVTGLDGLILIVEPLED